MVTSDVHSILILGPTKSEINVDLSTSIYDTAEILHKLGYKTSIIIEDPTFLLSSVKFFDKIFVRKVNGESVLEFLEKFHPDAILPTLGDRNALGIISGLNDKLRGTKILGTNKHAALSTFKREVFVKTLMQNDLPVINFISSSDEEEIYDFIRSIDFPIIARRRYSNRNSSGWTNIKNIYELDTFMSLEEIEESKIEIERSIRGFSEYSFTVVRDRFDNSALMGSIEDIEPIGIHHLDSHLISPAISLNDSKYQKLRNYSIKLAQVFDIQGACTVHFAYNHETHDCYITEFIPRLSEETKFLEYAASYPMATVAVELSLGYRLDKLQIDAGTTFNGATENFMDHITSRIPQWNDSEPQYLGPSKTSNDSLIVNGLGIEEVLNRGSLNDKLNNTSQKHDYLKKLSDDELFEKIIHPTNWLIDVIVEAIHRGFELEELRQITNINMPYLTALENISNFNLMDSESLSIEDIEQLTSYGIKGIGNSKIIQESKDPVNHTVVKRKQSVPVQKNEYNFNNYFVTSGISNDLKFSDKNKIIVRSPIVFGKRTLMAKQFVLMQLSQSIQQNGLEMVVVGREPWNSPLSVREKVFQIDDPHYELNSLNIIPEEKVFKIIDLSETVLNEDDSDKVFKINSELVVDNKLESDISIRLMSITDGSGIRIPSLIYRNESNSESFEIGSYNNFLTETEKDEIYTLISNALEENDKINIFSFDLVYLKGNWVISRIYHGIDEDIIIHELGSSIHMIDTLVKLILGNTLEKTDNLEEIFKNTDQFYLLIRDNKKIKILPQEDIENYLFDSNKKED
ncbi:ATP-grasp domain-containing protein [Lactobacillus terrae]|uniref:ATP-binding protein n=1 Tax=Lactobacillus terrae TaxID=2269374 RepID=UPI000C1B787E|nr:ATP-grasp domain-containing protein [Lactobacillus terrae]